MFGVRGKHKRRKRERESGRDRGREREKRKERARERQRQRWRQGERQRKRKRDGSTIDEGCVFDHLMIYGRHITLKSKIIYIGCLNLCFFKHMNC